MILTEGLSKRFDQFLAVDRVSLSVGKGEILALLGPNGAGKTTTVRMLSSVLQPSEGRAWVANYDIIKQAAQVRASVGVLTEHHGLYNRMPGGEYLDFFGRIYHLDQTTRATRVLQLMNHFGLSEYIERPIAEYSKGMRQKLALARALLHNPSVLLLDEPTSAMDPESAHLVREAIRALRSEERTIVICTHNLSEAEELSDQIAIIRRGKIIAQGSPGELKAHMLGPEEFALQLANPLNGYHPTLPPDAKLVATGSDWIRFQAADPKKTNPIILQKLIAQGLEIVSLQEIPRSLEQVYLRAVNSPDNGEVWDAG